MNTHISVHQSQMLGIWHEKGGVFLKCRESLVQERTERVNGQTLLDDQIKILITDLASDADAAYHPYELCVGACKHTSKSKYIGKYGDLSYVA